MFMQYTHTSMLFYRVTIDKSGCTFKHEFGSCGTGIHESGRVDVLWLFYFCTIKLSTSLAAVEQGITIWKELMSFGCFISAHQLNLMQPW